MKGYHKIRAVDFIVSKFSSPPSFLSDNLTFNTLVSQAIDADLAFMLDSGVIDEEGFGTDIPYDEDEALESILDTLMPLYPLPSEEVILLIVFINDFLEFQYEFMLKEGLVHQD